MKVFVKWMSVVVAAATLVVSCSKDKPSGSLAFDEPAVFLTAGQTVTVGFKASNNISAASYTVSAKPEGWVDPIIDAEARTVTLKAPDAITDGIAKTGSITITAAPKGGTIASATLFAGVVDRVDLTAKKANSYLATKADTYYEFDATYKGGASTISPASLGIVWQSQTNLVQYVRLTGGKGSFYIGSNDDGNLKEGNAVIGAYDAGGTLLWSWHIWATDYDPSKDELAYANYTVMGRNLGALKNSNASTADILASYGLYYQWGRKDPFAGPSTYNAANGASAAIYSGTGSRIYLKMEATTAAIGTAEYATQNPLVFLTGTEESKYDWLASAHSDALWSASSKTAADPCPYGWRIAPADAFNSLSISADLAAGDAADKYYDAYGWTLANGSVEGLYIGAGRRVYTNGSIQNIYNPLPVRNSAIEAQPWIGYYWTAGTQSSAVKSLAFTFWFCKADVPASGVENGAAHFRSNGMSVRCVKEVR